MRTALLALALLAPLAPEALAQADAPLRPGDVDVSAVEPYVYEYRIHVVAPVQQVFGTATETLTVEGGEALSVVSIAGQGMSQTDSVSFAWPTLEPIRETSLANGAAQTFEFTGMGVAGVLRDGDAVDATFEAPVFASGAADLIARAMLLDEGATAQIVSFDDDAPDTPVVTTITTTGQEEVLGRTAWIVTAVGGDNDVTYAFDAETGETLRVAFSPQPGVQIELRRMDLDAEKAK